MKIRPPIKNIRLNSDAKGIINSQDVAIGTDVELSWSPSGDFVIYRRRLQEGGWRTKWIPLTSISYLQVVEQ